jgi:WD40 repeat protein/serine/threonine protein kinase
VLVCQEIAVSDIPKLGETNDAEPPHDRLDAGLAIAFGSGALPASADWKLFEGPGAVIGPCKLLQQIGEGGMGVVYMAEQQEPVRRKVAFKIIKPGMDSAQVIARFEAERQALAMMDHQNIAKVFDAGTTTGDPGCIRAGRPYFVMELVHGVPITTFCDENQLTPRERLELFVPVCQAIQHAHQKGIIHRDIKPSNVLVTLYDDKPVPKVIDFGVAKAIEQRLTEKTLFTQFGVLVGTFEYMSPEQAEMNALGVDTPSDIYSLGVLLYELLTGTTPLERERLGEAALSELVRLIKEEEPPRPSVRLSSSNTLPKIAAARKTEPARLPMLVRGEIDWIVMKCLEKNRSRRYDTANSLARDVERYLHDEPVEACPPSAGYRLRKFVRKHRMPLIVAAAFGMLLVAGVVVSTWQAVRARRAESDAVLQRDLTDKEAIHARTEKKEADKARQAAEEQRAAAEAGEYAGRINLAQQAWGNGNLLRVRKLLEETAAYPHRGFEWYYLQRLCHLELQTLIGHHAAVTFVSWSPDGTRLATASWDRTAKVWEVAGGRELLTLQGHTSGVYFVSWSPDGQRLATGSMDGTAKVWEAVSGRELFTLKGHTDMVCSVVWSPDGLRLATGSMDRTAKVWDAASGRELFTLHGHTQGVKDVAWSPAGKRLATASFDGTAKVWEVAGWRELFTLQSHVGGVWSASWSPDSKRLATGGFGDGTAKVWEAASGRELLTLKAQPMNNLCVSWSPDGQRLATGSGGGTAKVWEAANGRELLSLKSHASSVSWSPDSKRLATASYSGMAKIWEAAAGRELVSLEQKSPVASVGWSPDGKRLLTGCFERTAKVLDAASGRELLTLQGHTDSVRSVACSRDGRRLATGSADGTAKVWDAASGREICSLQGHESMVASLSWSPNDQRLATGSMDGTAKVWEVSSSRELFTLAGHKNAVVSVSWSRDGQFLATASADGTARLWEGASGRETACLEHPSAVLAVSWSPDGQWLATGSRDGTAKVWEVPTGRELLTLRGHTEWVNSVSWSPDGRRLATGSDDRTAKVWDLAALSANSATGRELLTLQGHTGSVWSVSWSPDGQRLATASEDGTIKVWEAAAAESVHEWAEQERAVAELLAREAVGGPLARGFIHNWLLLAPIPLGRGDRGAKGLQLQQLPDEARLQPRHGERVQVGAQSLVWHEIHSPVAVFDFNTTLGRTTEWSVAYLVCYLVSDRARNDLSLQVSSDDQAKVYLNGLKVYAFPFTRGVGGLDPPIPVALRQGRNVLVFKVVNEEGAWQGCLRLVDSEGRPAKGIHVRLTLE